MGEVGEEYKIAFCGHCKGPSFREEDSQDPAAIVVWDWPHVSFCRPCLSTVVPGELVNDVNRIWEVEYQKRVRAGSKKKPPFLAVEAFSIESGSYPSSPIEEKPVHA